MAYRIQEFGKFREPFEKQIARTLSAFDLPCKCSLVPRSWLPDLLTQRQSHRDTGTHTPQALTPKGVGPNTKVNEASFDNFYGRLKRRTRPMGAPIKLKPICNKDK